MCHTNANICGHVCKQMKQDLILQKKYICRTSMCLCARKCNKILFCKIIFHCISDARLNAEEFMCQHMRCTKLHTCEHMSHICNTQCTHMKHMTNICETCAVHMLFVLRNICAEKCFYICKMILFMQNYSVKGFIYIK